MINGSLTSGFSPCVSIQQNFSGSKVLKKNTLNHNQAHTIYMKQRCYCSPFEKWMQASILLRHVIFTEEKHILHTVSHNIVMP